MTVEAMSSLPFQAGSAVAAAAGRTALWAISAYMRQPLRNTALAALIGLSAMAGSNALYKQSHHHPAPLFGTFSDPAPVQKKARSTVMPAERPLKLAQPVSQETTGSVDEPSSTPTLIGHDDVAMLQQKLADLGMFTGSVDGLFGPRTAKAIKAYESSVGRTPRGLLTPAIIATIRDTQSPPAAIAVPEATPIAPAIVPKTELPVLTATAELPPQVLALQPTKPLPAPAPLLTPTADTAQTAVVAALEPADPVVAAKPSPFKRSVPTIAVHAAPAPAVDAQTMPSQLAPVTEGEDAASDPTIVATVQQGLNNLDFLHQQVDGIASEATAKAIRNFEVYFNYDVTGRVTRQLVKLLEQNGADI